MTNIRTTTLIRSVRDDLRERRAARAEYRALKAALASYRSPAEIDDLLVMADDENAESALVRDILSGNLRQYHATHGAGLGAMRYSA
ncbi:hypothetical protein GA707_01500 [Nostocoides sp. F2B08]|uniref:hypothetical protein n=1 Tax=Nostocoides sp. F2B08 TaxID=2653936 RepID=UPI0012631CA0|nr:hypothetical protein [Tetrasphaera sp. F2B08]KAB7746226.1 hypothetical protein GA707_01500 [Tetrasphaera sp. F2B08]